MRRFDEGVTQLLSNVSLFSEGLDIPECDCIILGRRTASPVLYRQAAGRGMRVKKDLREGLFVDLAGNVDIHGLPDLEVEWTLEGGVEEESAQKARVSTRTCAKCSHSYSNRKPSCPLCGSEHVVKTAIEIDVELEEVRREKREEERRRGNLQRELNRKVVQTGGDMDKLRALQAEYGKPRNIIHVWKKWAEPIWERDNLRKKFSGGVGV